MSTFHVEESLVIEARPEALYAIVADYRVGHPAILPRPFFFFFSVEQGGVGAGTVVRSTVKVMGKLYPLHHRVTEPEPGRILQESDLDKPGEFTRFIFQPLNDATHTRVTIATEFLASPGLMGFMERLTKPGLTHKMYQQELRNLADYVRTQPPAPAN